ncbi:MAG: SprT family zinc-dependent metalloprotease [Alphaproteobacteria bacterium]|nr:SprT family zinc-dependent metalloprotease [Alphaproteobacteria bacterium]
MIDKDSPLESGLVALGGERVLFSVSRSKKRKRTIAFKMERDGGLRVLAPASVSLGAVTKILQKRAAWIARERADRRKAAPAHEYTDGAAFSYLGHSCALRITQGDHAPRSCRLAPHVLHIHVPDETLSQENLREEVRLEILLWVKKRARVKLKRRLDLWAGRLGVRYKKLAVTAPEHRWGSCSADNVIRLNWKLMLAPLPILDYVAAHELCHVRHKNHSPRFWNFLAQAMPDYKTRRKYLRSIERKLMI